MASRDTTQSKPHGAAVSGAMAVGDSVRTSAPDSEDIARPLLSGGVRVWACPHSADCAHRGRCDRNDATPAVRDGTEVHPGGTQPVAIAMSGRRRMARHVDTHASPPGPGDDPIDAISSRVLRSLLLRL